MWSVELFMIYQCVMLVFCGERIFWGEEIGAKFSVLGNFVPYFFLKVSRKVEFLRIIRYICKQEK